MSKKDQPYLKIKYKDREYLIEDLFGESHDLLKELVLPDILNPDFFVTDFGLFNDKGYAIAGEKFGDLYSVLATARFALYNAHLKIHNDQKLLESEYSDTLWLRGQYLQNSIIWYDSCEDYILQIVWFAFDFYKNLNRYEDEMRRCKYSNICKELDKYKDLKNAELLLKYLSSYHQDDNVKFVRNLADSLKHKQLINIMGLDTGRLMSFKSNTFSSSLLEKKWIDLDESIEKIKQVHMKIIELGLLLIEFINFQGMFVLNEAGHIELGKCLNKREYKKIIINEEYST